MTSSLKFVTWNSGRKSVTDSLRGELALRKQNICLCLNETSNLPNLDEFRLNGVRHTDTVKTQGLCVFISSQLQHYSHAEQSKYSIFGYFNLPTVVVNDIECEPLKIGFIATYRSPSLSQAENSEYFADLTMIIEKLQVSCSLVYLMGDINAYKHRVSRVDHNLIIRANNSATKSYEMLVSSISSRWDHHFSGVTHRPYQQGVTTCAQLDYMIVIFSEDRHPKGKCKSIVTMSDHDALVLVVNVPKLRQIKIKFENFDRRIDVDFDLMNSVLRQEAEAIDFSAMGIELSLAYLEQNRIFIEENTGRGYTVRKPAAKGISCHIALLQNRACKAKKRGDFAVYGDIVKEIRRATTELAEFRMQSATRNRCSRSFYSWASQVAKPCKVQFGKNVMVDKTVSEITSEINANYCNSLGVEDIEVRNFVGLHKEGLYKRLRSFDFLSIFEDIQKVPYWFKRCKSAVIFISIKIIRHIIETGSYPDYLKLSKADILPSRTIFQSFCPYGKLVEAFFADCLVQYVNRLRNFAYRSHLSCTALLLKQFDVFACEPVCVAFNGDLVKAFDRMSRKLIYDRIDDPLLGSIIWSFMDRSKAPYVIWWREGFHEIDRSSWNRGVEPGSVLGPLLFIIGLNDSEHFNGGLSKGFFSDDGLPLYRHIDDMNSAASDFISHIYKHGMELHAAPSKKSATFMIIGSKKSEFDFDELNIPIFDGSYFNCSRSHRVKQLGLHWYVDPKSGKPMVDLGELISRLKGAAAALRGISKYVLSSVAIRIIKTYILCVISYAITVWFPLAYIYTPKELEQLRYWYASVCMYVCADNKDCLGWNNSSKSMSYEASITVCLKELTGLPLLHEIYQASARSHYVQVLKMYELGWLRGVVKKFTRIEGRLIYCRSCSIPKNHVSPLQCLISSVNFTGRTKLSFPTDESWLVKLEKELLGKSDMRTLQKILTLAHFGKIADSLKRSRLTQAEVDVLEGGQAQIQRFLRSAKRRRIDSATLSFPAGLRK